MALEEAPHPLARSRDLLLRPGLERVLDHDLLRLAGRLLDRGDPQQALDVQAHPAQKPELLAAVDAFDVDPHAESGRLEPVAQPANEVLVFARVRDEDVVLLDRLLGPRSSRKPRIGPSLSILRASRGGAWDSNPDLLGVASPPPELDAIHAFV